MRIPIFIALITSAAGCVSPALPVRSSSHGAAPVLSQLEIGPMACGPVALLNSLLAGTERHSAVVGRLAGERPEEKVWSLVDEYASGPSVTYGEPRRLYDEEGGTTPEDLEVIARKLLVDNDLPPLRRAWLDRAGKETQEDQLRRVHALLSKGEFPPLLELRAFAAQENSEGKNLWNGLAGHWVSLVGLDPLPDGPISGFRMTCADSANGREVTAFVRCERQRTFTATKGFSVAEDGRERWRWVKNSPYLLVTAPDLSLGTSQVKWHERTIIALTQALVEE